jgi:hypothetical protein
MRSAWNIARMGEMKYTIFWSENLNGEDNLEDLGVDGKTVLEWILGKKGGGLWTGRIWFRAEKGGGLLCTR